MASGTQTETAGRIRIGGNKTGAWLARYALEQLPVSHTFGIPGVHTTELYDELNQSEKVRPILVTHEVCGAFAADAISRTGGGRVGCLVIVPAAGVTHAMSGIGECYLDGIPLLVITGGPRTDVPFGYQLHEIDQQRLVDGIVKASWKVKEHSEIVPVIFQAYRTAVSGVPGPVLVEIPVNLQLFSQRVEDVPAFTAPVPESVAVDRDLDAAVRMLCAAQAPGIFAGWGAVDVADSVQKIAEILGAPVSTTLQGLSAFPGNHPLHTGMGFSRAAVPAAENAFAKCDCMLAIGVSFGEIPTGSFGCPVPENLIHIDISRKAIGRNFPAKIGLVGDSRIVVPELLARLQASGAGNPDRRSQVEARIAGDKSAYREEWHNHQGDRVNPALFFEELRTRLRDDAIMTVDDGNHTFLAAELFQVRAPRSFISPTDFNSMGYAVPAAIGAKLANPNRPVVSIVGDGELSQISQGQEIPYNRKSCTTLGTIRIKGIAEATGAHYVAIENNSQIASGIAEALAAAQDRPVIVDVHVDYSKRTRFTRGVVQTALKRFPLRDRIRFIARALVRKVTG
jgi:acetolactate synthase I/II/III large subunit